MRLSVARVERWRMRPSGWPEIQDGLLRSYRRGRRAFKRARKQPTAENLHEWRKRVKDVWYQRRLLRAIFPETMAAHAREAHQLSDLLGDDHDLALLNQVIADIENELTVSAEPVIGLIAYQGGQLQTKAFSLGERVYAEKPHTYAKRIHRYWNAWRGEARANTARRPRALADAARP